MGTGNLDRSAVGSIEVNSGSGWQTLGIIGEEVVRVNGEEITHFDTSGHPPGIDKTVFGSLNVEIEFKWREIADIDLWHIVLHGGGVTTTMAGIQTVTAENMTMGDVDWIALAHAADFTFDGPVGVTSQDGEISYVEGSDYYIDRKGGHFKRIEGGAIAEGQTVHVDYTYNTYVGKYFKIFENREPIDYTVRLTKPLLNGDNLRITHSRVNFSSTTELPLRPEGGGTWASVTGKIRFLKDDEGIYGAYGRWEIYTP